MLLLLLDGICAVALLSILLDKQMEENRGTNTLTKFVRHSYSWKSYKFIAFGAILSSAIAAFIGYFIDAVYACLPTVGVLVFTYIFKYMNNACKQRKHSARAVTKTSASIAGQAAPVVGTAIGTACGNPMAGAAVGISTGEVLEQCSDNMVVPDAPNVCLTIKDPDKFMEAAGRCGIPTEGRQLIDVANDVVRFAPSSAIEALPDNMPVDEKAKRILGGDY